MGRLFVPVAVAALLTAGCGPGGTAVSSPSAAASPRAAAAPFIPQIVNAEAVVGRDRLLFGILDAAGTKPIGGPDTTVSIAFEPAPGTAGGQQIAPVAARFIWAIQGERGLWVVEVDLPAAGDWLADVRATGGGVDQGTVQVGFPVHQKGSAIAVGEPAPSTVTPILADVGGEVKRISTDPKPDASFYQVSEADALARHEPFVFVFATPAFCRSSQCGPTLDVVKAVAKDEPGFRFINVEPYLLTFTDGRLQPVLDASGGLQPTPITTAWGILTEPYIYVVGRDGIVTASFEAIVSPDELKAAIAAVR